MFYTACHEHAGNLMKEVIACVGTWAACGSSPQVHSISGLSLDGFVSSESLFGVDDCESSGLLGKLR